MVKVNVYFKFETQEKWIDFGEKFFAEKEFIKHSPFAQQIIAHNEQFRNIVLSGKCDIIISCRSYIETKSAKTLKLLNEWIKENNYYNNYYLRDNWGNRMGMDIDSLLEWWYECHN